MGGGMRAPHRQQDVLIYSDVKKGGATVGLKLVQKSTHLGLYIYICFMGVINPRKNWGHHLVWIGGSFPSFPTFSTSKKINVDDAFESDVAIS